MSFGHQPVEGKAGFGVRRGSAAAYQTGLTEMRYTAGLEVSTKIDIKPGELRCPRCFSKDVVDSAPRGFRDEFMAAWSRTPKHCRACGRRFYVRVRKAEDPDESLSTGPDAENRDDPPSPPTET